MTVGAVSLYSYSSSVQYQYFGTSISDDRIKLLLAKYGIKQTDDPSADLRALYEAMNSDPNVGIEVIGTTASQQPQSSQAIDSENSLNVPWETLMSQIGLTVTGNLATDYTAFKNKILLMQLNATSQQDKASINQLEAEASIVFVQQDQSAKELLSTQNSTPSVTGADIQARLNRLFLLG